MALCKLRPNTTFCKASSGCGYIHDHVTDAAWGATQLASQSPSPSPCELFISLPPIRFHVDNKLGRPTNPGTLYKGPPLACANWSTLWRTRTDMNLARPKPVLCMHRCSSSPADLEHLTKTERQRLVSCTQVEHISVEGTAWLLAIGASLFLYQGSGSYEQYRRPGCHPQNLSASSGRCTMSCACRRLEHGRTTAHAC